ncbi:hypothetical protein UY3_06527 [Chelonia mydas]|uniref:Myb/SANT-like DNA-binding domain-containing protein n=1 Tax=Chelonia mydas TaxID=8469 RepID=M7C6Z2_CHEMY|nr:hypothetical protein UY3_06527 [Chelonia mydas]
MPPSVRRSPVWSNGKVLDLSVWGEEAVQSQLGSSRRHYDTFWQISRDMMEKGQDRDALQCRVKVKELRNVYHKARKANSCSGAAPATCRFYKELDATLGGEPTSTPTTTMDTSEPSSTRQEEEQQSGSEGGEAEEDTPESLDACSQELFSSQKEGSLSWRPVLVEGQTPEKVPDFFASLHKNDFLMKKQRKARAVTHPSPAMRAPCFGNPEQPVESGTGSNALWAAIPQSTSSHSGAVACGKGAGGRDILGPVPTPHDASVHIPAIPLLPSTFGAIFPRFLYCALCLPFRSAEMEPKLLRSMLTSLVSTSHLAVELFLMIQSDSEGSNDDSDSSNTYDTSLLVAFTDLLTTTEHSFQR